MKFAPEGSQPEQFVAVLCERLPFRWDPGLRLSGGVDRSPDPCGSDRAIRPPG